MNKDILIIGGGVSGIYAAIEASSKSSNILLVENEKQLGGSLRRLPYNEFKVNSNIINGKDYLNFLVQTISKTQVEIWTESYASKITKEDSLFSVDIVTKEGLKNVKAKSIINATGYHEKTASQSFIPGCIIAGIFTSSTILNYVNLMGYLPTKKCIFYGSTDLALSTAESLILNGAEVLGVFDDRLSPLCLDKTKENVLTKYNIPLYLSHTITNVFGKDRVEAIEVSEIVDGKIKEDTRRIIECDALIVSQGFILDNMLLEPLNAKMSLWTKGPIVDQNSMTSIDGLFATGNSLIVHNDIESKIMNAKEVGINASKYKQSERKLLEINFDENFLFITPEVIDLNSNLSSINFFFRSAKHFTDKKVKVYLDKKEIFTKEYSHLNPPKMEYISLDLKKCEITEDSNIMFKIE